MNKLFDLFSKVILIIILCCSWVNSYSQKKNSLFFEVGAGLQFSKTKIPNSGYSSIVKSNDPKLFLGFGLEHKLNKQFSLCLNLNSNFSKTEHIFNYINDTDQFSYSSNWYHVDLNYGLSLGIKYFPGFGKGRLLIGTGFNFQKLSPQMLFYENQWTNIDSFTALEITYSNDFNKNDNSLVYYLNAGYSLGKKRKNDLILELNSTLNKPVWGSKEFYYNKQLIEKSSYKINMLFAVLKFRRRL